MRIEVSDQELDYVYRLLMARPMVEAEPLVIKLRVQISQQARKEETPASATLSGESVDELPALP